MNKGQKKIYVLKRLIDSVIFGGQQMNSRTLSIRKYGVKRLYWFPLHFDASPFSNEELHITLIRWNDGRRIIKIFNHVELYFRFFYYFNNRITIKRKLKSLFIERFCERIGIDPKKTEVRFADSGFPKSCL